MTDLPRSRAIVRLDGPGHIMPIEPMTPPDSPVWRIVHLPIILGLASAGLLAVAALAIGLLGFTYRVLAQMPGTRHVAPVIGAGVAVLIYLAFVRLIERRWRPAELERLGWFKETALGFGGGLLVSGVSFLLIWLLGGVSVAETNPLSVLATPLLVRLCTAITIELFICGLGFRLIERWLGSWFTLVLTAVLFAAARLYNEGATPPALLASALEAAILLAALYMLTRRLWAAIGMNAGWRFAQIALFGQAMGEGGARGWLLSTVDGPDWLTGGVAGVDASAVALAVDALVLAGLLMAAARLGRIVRPVWRRGKGAWLDADAVEAMA